MNKSKLESPWLRLLMVGMAAAAGVLVGCSGSGSTGGTPTGNGGTGFGFGNGNLGNGVGAGGVSTTQVEQLARPAIAEGTFINNDDLNTWNSLSAVQQLPQLLAGGTNLATNQILFDIASSLAEFAVAGGDATAGAAAPFNVPGGVRVDDEAVSLVPDVMRIDTTVACPQVVGGVHTRLTRHCWCSRPPTLRA